MTTCRPSRRSRENEQSTLGSQAYPTSCAALALLVVLALLGCAHQPPAPLSQETQAQLRTIGVVAARFAPEVDYRAPGQGGAGGAVIGVAKGVGLGTLTAAVCFVTIGHAPEACGLALGTPYFAVRYAVDQAKRGVSADEIAAGEAAIRAVFAARNSQEAVRDHVLSFAAAHIGQPVTPLPDLGPTTPAETGSYRHLTPHGVDTVLEVTVQRMALEPHAGRGKASGSVWRISADELNPTLYLDATTRTRVIKTADDSVLFVATRQHEGRAATFTEWAANDAQALRDELDRFLPCLAAEVVTQVFGVSVSPASEPACPAEPAAGTEPEAPFGSTAAKADGPSE